MYMYGRGHEMMYLCLEHWDCVSVCLMMPAKFPCSCDVREMLGGRESFDVASSPLAIHSNSFYSDARNRGNRSFTHLLVPAPVVYSFMTEKTEGLGRASSKVHESA